MLLMKLKDQRLQDIIKQGIEYWERVKDGLWATLEILRIARCCGTNLTERIWPRLRPLVKFSLAVSLQIRSGPLNELA